jgi:hypothetical protein
LRTWWRLAGKLLTSEREESGTVSAGEITEVANADEASGQHMLTEATQELCRGKRHDALLISVRVVFPSEAYRATIEAEQALVADGDAVGIAAEVFQHMSGSAEGRLGINHPFFVFEGSQELGEGAGVAQRFQLSKKLQGASGVSLLESLQYEASKESEEDFDWQQKSAAGGDPTFVAG